jgi:hypothetical protein
MKQKYNVHKAGALRRNIAFTLTFEQWATIWLDSGKWDERGWGADSYCMSRFGDVGGYEAGNVFIQTNRENGIEANTGRKHTDEMKFKSGASSRGKKQSAEHIMKRTQSLIGVKHSPERIAKKTAGYIAACAKRKLLQGV